ncbi:glycerate dehydrogenase [Leuconostoc sp. MS02]|uniref:Glycerate dehydrogenase n=1 Tax=Leuconostoc aquikimchii TaxID=3236804 RepID=A0ABV3S097_9LACO
MKTKTLYTTLSAGAIGVVVIAGVTLYSGYQDNKSQQASSAATTKKVANVTSKKAKATTSSAVTEQVSSSSSAPKERVLVASGTDYHIVLQTGGVGGAFGHITPITQLLDENSILDVAASVPNLNNSTLISIVPNDNSWKISLKHNDKTYNLTIIRATPKYGMITVESDGQAATPYLFDIPASIVDADTKATQDITEEEAIKIANKYGQASEPFTLNTTHVNDKSETEFYLNTPLRKGTAKDVNDLSGTPDTREYAIVSPVDRGHAHLKVGNWTSTSASHAPFFDEDVVR